MSKKKVKTRKMEAIHTVDDLIKQLRKNYDRKDLVLNLFMQIAVFDCELREDGYVSNAFTAAASNSCKELIEYRKQQEEKE